MTFYHLHYTELRINLMKHRHRISSFVVLIVQNKKLVVNVFASGNYFLFRAIIYKLSWCPLVKYYAVIDTSVLVSAILSSRGRGLSPATSTGMPFNAPSRSILLCLPQNRFCCHSYPDPWKLCIVMSARSEGGAYSPS